MRKPSFYEVLGVPTEATDVELEAAWRRLIRENHPDAAPEAERRSANERTAVINEAYQTLIDPKQRARYDRRNAARASTPRFGAHSSSDVERAIDALVRFRRQRRSERRRIVGAVALGIVAVAYTLRTLSLV